MQSRSFDRNKRFVCFLFRLFVFVAFKKYLKVATVPECTISELCTRYMSADIRFLCDLLRDNNMYWWVILGSVNDNH